MSIICIEISVYLSVCCTVAPTWKNFSHMDEYVRFQNTCTTEQVSCVLIEWYKNDQKLLFNTFIVQKWSIIIELWSFTWNLPKQMESRIRLFLRKKFTHSNLFGQTKTFFIILSNTHWKIYTFHTVAFSLKGREGIMIQNKIYKKENQFVHIHLTVLSPFLLH